MAARKDPRPLEDVRLVDLSLYAPGPFCSLVCARLGAEVIKVEPLRGDPMRELDAAAFGRLNASKKSVRLDLKTTKGKSILWRLVETSDVFIEGFRPGVMSRLGFDHERLRGRMPRLVYVSITGYGQSGPRRDRSGHDVNYMAAAGALDGVPRPLAVQVADFAAGGLYGALAVLAALMERSRTGLGRFIDVSMLAGLEALMPLASGPAAERLSGRFANYTVYRTKDDKLLSVGALENKFWERFCEALGQDDWIERRDDPSLRAEVERVVASKTSGEWSRLFETTDACVEAVRSAEERGAGADVDVLPFATDAGPSLPAPELGEHTDDVLAELGLSADERAGLRAEGVC